MAPFPETEIMTIKRLEVALRKMDFKLLKDGAYKLHEKYHSGFQFEYLDMLKDLFMDISNNSSIPEDIKDILTPTIEDILSSQGIKTDITTSPYESLNQQRVSSLTSLSYNTQNENNESKMNAFDAFGTDRTHVPTPPRIFAQSPFSAEPFKEYQLPQNQYTQNLIHQQMPVENPEIVETFSSVEKEENIQTNIATNRNDINDEIKEDAIIENSEQQIVETQNENIQEIEVQEEVKKEIKSISIFYSQDSSLEKMRNILKYRDLISKQNENFNINELLDLISEINVQSNTNVQELKGLLDQLKLKENKINLITNSLSANLINMFKEIEISYSFFDKKEDKKINFLPIFGLTNLFKCTECSQEYIETNSDITPLVLQCPKCKKSMFPDFYTNSKTNCEINLDYYNSSIVELANSKVWLLIHPSIEEKITFNLIKNALKVSNQVEEIYILDKDINVRETYRKMIHDINENIKVNIQMNATEEFFNSIS